MYSPLSTDPFPYRGLLNLWQILSSSKTRILWKESWVLIDLGHVMQPNMTAIDKHAEFLLMIQPI